MHYIVLYINWGLFQKEIKKTFPFEIGSKE
jgi:hypothetical protein